MHSTEQVNNCNDIKRDENHQLSLEVEAINKHIILLQDQNRELEKELDRFLQCDNEIRSKLIDRERSPLRECDLYCNFKCSESCVICRRNNGEQVPIHQHREDVTSTPNLLDLKMCPQTSSGLKEPPQRYSPLRNLQFSQRSQMAENPRLQQSQTF